MWFNSLLPEGSQIRIKTFYYNTQLKLIASVLGKLAFTGESMCYKQMHHWK